ncbi:MAG: hypothetical protein N4A36_03185 [Candidatus Gracilibacteria bacterium]|nr:hypothetical protein [Candidatus Gracilibacteria bacterium]
MPEVPNPFGEQTEQAKEALENTQGNIEAADLAELAQNITKDLDQLSLEVGLKQETYQKAKEALGQLASNIEAQKLGEVYKEMGDLIKQDQEYVLARGNRSQQIDALIFLMQSGGAKIDTGNIDNPSIIQSALKIDEDGLEQGALDQAVGLLAEIRDNYPDQIGYIQVNEGKIAIFDQKGELIKANGLESSSENLEKTLDEHLKSQEDYQKQMADTLKSNRLLGMLDSMTEGKISNILINVKGPMGMFLKSMFGLKNIDRPKLDDETKTKLTQKFELTRKMESNDQEPQKDFKEGSPPFIDNTSRVMYENLSQTERNIFNDAKERFSAGGEVPMMQMTDKNEMTISAPNNQVASAMLLFYQKNSLSEGFERQEGIKNVLGSISEGLEKLKSDLKMNKLDLGKMGFEEMNDVDSNFYPLVQENWPNLVQASYENGKVVVRWQQLENFQELLPFKDKQVSPEKKQLDSLNDANKAMSGYSLNGLFEGLINRDIEETRKEFKAPDLQADDFKNLVKAQIADRFNIPGARFSNINEGGFVFSKPDWGSGDFADVQITKTGSIWGIEGQKVSSPKLVSILRSYMLNPSIKKSEANSMPQTESSTQTQTKPKTEPIREPVVLQGKDEVEIKPKEAETILHDSLVGLAEKEGLNRHDFQNITQDSFEFKKQNGNIVQARQNEDSGWTIQDGILEENATLLKDAIILIGENEKTEQKERHEARVKLYQSLKEYNVNFGDLINIQADSFDLEGGDHVDMQVKNGEIQFSIEGSDFISSAEFALRANDIDLNNLDSARKIDSSSLRNIIGDLCNVKVEYIYHDDNAFLFKNSDGIAHKAVFQENPEFVQIYNIDRGKNVDKGIVHRTTLQQATKVKGL